MATAWQQNYEIYRRYVRNLSLLYQKRQDLQMFTELLLTLSATAIFAIFAIRPTLITIIGLNKDISGKEQTTAQLDAKIQALADAQMLYDRNVNTINLIHQAIPDRPYPVLFARQIEGLSSVHNLSLIGMNTENIPVIGASSANTVAPTTTSGEANQAVDNFPQTAQEFEFELNLVGNYESISNFLVDFEALRTPMYQDTLNIQISETEFAGQLLLSISGRIAYFTNE